MKVVMPQPIILIESNLPEETIATWQATKTYAKENQVLYNSYIFVSLKDNNLNNRPSSNSNALPDYWLKLRSSNRMAMFDDIIATQSIAPAGQDTITVTIEANSANAFALLNMDATELHITASENLDGSNPYYTEDLALIRDSIDWWAYYFEAPSVQRDFVKTNLPMSPRGYLTVRLKSYERSPAIGHLVIGQLTYLGETLYGITASFRSYSRKKTDDFGNTYLAKGRAAKRFDGMLYVQPRLADMVYEKLMELDAIPALWIGDNRDALQGGHQSLTVYGWLESFNEQFRGPNEVGLSIEIQGLV